MRVAVGLTLRQAMNGGYALASAGNWDWNIALDDGSAAHGNVVLEGVPEYRED